MGQASLGDFRVSVVSLVMSHLAHTVGCSLVAWFGLAQGLWIDCTRADTETGGLDPGPGRLSQGASPGEAHFPTAGLAPSSLFVDGHLPKHRT